MSLNRRTATTSIRSISACQAAFSLRSQPVTSVSISMKHQTNSASASSSHPGLKTAATSTWPNWSISRPKYHPRYPAPGYPRGAPLLWTVAPTCGYVTSPVGRPHDGNNAFVHGRGTPRGEAGGITYQKRGNVDASPRRTTVDNAWQGARGKPRRSHHDARQRTHH